MRLVKARVQKYRSIKDTGEFEVETNKTILVGPNEAGKSAILQALQHLKRPDGVPPLDALRDYPRGEYDDISKKRVLPEDVDIVTGWFRLEDDDKAEIGPEFRDCIYVRHQRLDNSSRHDLVGGPTPPTYTSISKDLTRLAAHAESRLQPVAEDETEPAKPNATLAALVKDWQSQHIIKGKRAAALSTWLQSVLPLVDEKNRDEEERFDRLTEASSFAARKDGALEVLNARLPVFVLFNNYFRVRPLIHLTHLAERTEKNLLDDSSYDYGNNCLLKLLGFTARELADLGNTAEPPAEDKAGLKTYRDVLDRRAYLLNAASVRLTENIVEVWNPDKRRDEAAKLRVTVDRQYLKVVVEDELGVEIELDQRSEGFQWLVSFFVVFFAEALGKHKNAVLLLDEPGLSLHGFKQREFRKTISRLAQNNQTIYTTHSPFLVGPDELDFVRVVEMTDRKIGTKVHTTLTAGDPTGLLPLMEALGYDLAQSLFSQQRNLVLEGLTDFWYVEATAAMLRDAKLADLNETIALLPAGSAGKVVYHATILHAQKLKVAALLDSDAAGDQAAMQDTLVHTLGHKRILRTKDSYSGDVAAPEIEDSLRITLVGIAKTLSWDVEEKANQQSKRPIVELLASEVPDFSKYKLAKAYLRWTRDHSAGDLTADEREQWKKLIEKINAALK